PTLARTSARALDDAIARAIAFAPHADVVCATFASHDASATRAFSEAVRDAFTGKPLAFDATTHPDARSRELAAMGYALQFVIPVDAATDNERDATAAYYALVRAAISARASSVTSTHRHTASTGRDTGAKYPIVP